MTDGIIGQCSCGEVAEYYADNNEAGIAYAYCYKCEERRADKYGCAMFIAEGIMCDEGACGCDGTGFIRGGNRMIAEWQKDNEEVAR